MIGVQVRWMIRRDLNPEILDIELNSFEYPWEEDDFLCCLRQRNCIGMVAEFERRVIGFMIYELFPERMQLMTLAVASEFRRRGVGEQMVAKLIAKLAQQRRTSITLEVRETNLAAQLFFRKQGFKATRVIPDFYEDTPESAYAMEYTINEPLPVRH